MLKAYTVFNIAQCECIPSKLDTPKRNNATVDEIENVIREYAERIKLRVDYYDAKVTPFFTYVENVITKSVDTDMVVMPITFRFNDSNNYYATFFHELAHSNKTKSSLNRKMGKDS